MYECGVQSQPPEEPTGHHGNRTTNIYQIYASHNNFKRRFIVFLRHFQVYISTEKVTDKTFLKNLPMEPMNAKIKG